jgi:hypothetical protein
MYQRPLTLLMLLQLGASRTATVVANGYCELYSLSRADLDTAIEKFPELGDEFESLSALTAESATPACLRTKTLSAVPSVQRRATLPLTVCVSSSGCLHTYECCRCVSLHVSCVY